MAKGWKKAQDTVAAPSPAPAEIVAYKGFDANLKCRSFQFEIGKSYEHDGEVKICAAGFHACESPLDVFEYYPPGISRYGKVRQSGPLQRHANDSKVASAKITITAELKLPDFIGAAVKWLLAHASPAESNHSTGDRSAAISTGDQSAASSTGYQSAAISTGDQSAAISTGYQSAASSTGDQSAASSTGDQSAAISTGDQSAAISTGYQSAAISTGDQSAASSTGDQSAASSTGDRSAAISTGDRSAASSTGDQSAAMSSGREGRVMVADGDALFLVHRDENWNITHAWAGIAGRDGIKPLTWYTLNADGQPVEVGGGQS